MQNLLEIHNLKVVFSMGRQDIQAVDSVNLNIRKDEIVCLAGESGSGKTVTALAVTRLLPKNARIFSRGIIFNGRDLSGLDDRQLINIRGREIAYIFQEPASYLNPVFSIREQLTEVIILHQRKTKAEAEEEALELLRRVHINDPRRVLHSFPHQLSGGMNQRVFIAMALACRSRLLIADEPTTSLDVTTELQILDLLIELKKEIGFSLLFITHNLSIARRLADRVYVMFRGNIVEEAVKEDIFANPRHFHTRQLIDAYNKIGRINS